MLSFGKKAAGLLCICLAVLLSVIGVLQLSVYAKAPLFAEGVSPNFSNMLQQMFTEAYDLGDYDRLPLYKGLPM